MPVMRTLSLLIALLALVGCAQQPASATPSPTSTTEPDLPTPSATIRASHPLSEVLDGPVRDPFDLARRYRDVHADPLPDTRLFPDETVGTERAFWVFVANGPEVRSAQAKLLHVSAHALWYVESGVAVSQEALELTARTFDETLFPYVRDTFGLGKGPEGRITILHAKLSKLAGYFGGADQLPSSVDPLSNERTMLYLSTSLEVGSPAYLSTLTHELQHLVHYPIDRNEATWVEEGLSELAARGRGYPGLPVSRYLSRPGTSVTRWLIDPGRQLPHYAGASLFMSYLAGRTGGLASIGQLVEAPANGARGVQQYLDTLAPGVEMEELFADWAVANYVGASQGPYGYPGLPGLLQIVQRTIKPGTTDTAVNQYGAWYAAVDAVSPLEFSFTGAIATRLLPLAPPSGSYCWWSNRGNEMDSTLTRPLDLTGVESATLQFQQWHAIEEGYDYGYVAVSTDGGATWAPQEGLRTTPHSPDSQAFGPGYTGRSEGWVEERTDLTPYAGMEVLLRFEYVTDDSTSGDGWCVDDISVAEVGFFDDAESEGDWTVSGFVRAPVEGVAQRFALRLVHEQDDDVTVEEVDLDADNHATFTVAGPAVLVVTATAPKTSQPARFTIEARALIADD